MRGDYRFADRFERASRQAEDADIAKRRQFVADATAIDPALLSAADQITRDVLIYDASSSADLTEARLAELNADPIFGLHVAMSITLPRLTVDTPELAEAMIFKLGDMATTIAEATERLSEGVSSGRTPARFAVEGVIVQLDELIGHDIDGHPLAAVKSPESFDADQEASYRQAVAAVVTDQVIPAFVRQRDVLAEAVAPRARSNDEPGLCALEDGEDAYALAVTRWTTLDLTAATIHDIGLAQIDRLAGEYAALGSEALGLSDVDQVLAALRDDPDLHHDSVEEIRSAAEVAFERARAEMPEWFGRLPQTDCLVDTVTSGPLAFYQPPAVDGSRPGTFFMNVDNPSGWGRFLIEAMAFHEGIPGHHLQIGIAQELGDEVPRFQREAFISAYGEGWALYTERLADEMGLYSSPLTRMGMLWGDSMRACRLVVDTGMHALGWTREQAVQFMAANCPMAIDAVRSEIDRYAVFPGQALSYMIGRLEFDRLRSEAETAMGADFDIAAFHDTVLGSGLMPLPTLERLVNDWIRG
jgi:uncharacterized protein (DUF885 family)